MCRLVTGHKATALQEVKWEFQHSLAGNVVQEWFLKRGNCGFGLRWGIPAGLFMDTARLGGTQGLENVGLSSRIFI